MHITFYKTGGCPKTVALPQAASYHTDIENELMSVQTVKAQALRAKVLDPSEFVWGQLGDVKEGKDFDQVLGMVRTVRDLDMEVCCTLGMLTEDQARDFLKLVYTYNHNLDTSEEFYKKVLLHGYKTE